MATSRSGLLRLIGFLPAVTNPVPALDVSGIRIRSRNQDQQFKQLALEIGLTQAYALLAELRASVLPLA